MPVLRDIALVLLALEGAILTLMVLAVLAAISYGLLRFRWWHTIPRWFAVVRGYLALTQRIVERVCQAAVAPIFRVATTRAALSGILGSQSATRNPQSRIRR
ncbi:MAG TPA: hypothetical protein EYH30_02560 [Anaerolineales bacterium]|nr:hypothetical protein [Anaerolineales bacterium]HIQ01005.1 hypothetical protein [Anaerolineales bacterium]